MDENRLATYTEFIQKALEYLGQTELDNFLETHKHIIDAQLLEFVNKSINSSLLNKDQTRANALQALALRIDEFIRRHCSGDIVLQSPQTNTTNKRHGFILFWGTLTAVASIGIIGGEAFRHGYVVHLNNSGNAKYEKQMYEEAIRDYDQAITWNPKFAISYINRGNAKLQMGKYHDAIKDYDLAISIDNNLADAYYNRGNAKLQLGNFAEAIADYRNALQISPNHKQASNAISNIEQRIGFASKIQGSSLQKLEPTGNRNYHDTRKLAQTVQRKSALSDLETALRLAGRVRRAETYRRAQRLKPQLSPIPPDSRFPFPMDACGDQLDATAEVWYPVYVDFSQKLLTHIKSNYCRDAIQTVVDGKRLIQVASFVDRYKAKEFADLLKARVGSGKVGNPTVVNSGDFLFPMDACGDLPVSPKDRWYPVYLDYSESLLAHIKNNYCRDAVSVNVDGRRLIQVASFRNIVTAQRFADFLRERFGSGMVGEPVVP